MRTKPTHIFASFLTVVLCTAAFSINALAVKDTAPASPTSIPDGTGTVISTTTNGDGKEFLTIKTSDGHVFYLIVDKQKTGDNVYLLDKVTTKDLLSLTQIDSKDSDSTPVTDKAKNTQTPKPSSPLALSSTPSVCTPGASETSQTGEPNNTVKIAAAIILIAVTVSAVILFFKRSKPKAPAKDEKDPDDSDFLDDEDAEMQTEPQDEQEVPDEETECEDE